MTALVNSKPTNTWQRMGLLFRLEWGTQKKNILAVTGTLAIVAFAIAIMINSNSIDTLNKNDLKGFLFSLGCLFFATTGIYTYIAIQKQINSSKVITYTLIPASTREKFIVIALSFLFPIVWTILLLGVATLFLGILIPSTWAAVKDLWIDISTINIYVQDAEIEEMIKKLIKYFTISYIISGFTGWALGLWCSISIKSTTKSILAVIGINALISFVSSLLILPQIVSRFVYIQQNNITDGKELMSVFSDQSMFVLQVFFLLLIGIAFFILSYYSLKKRQLK